MSHSVQVQIYGEESDFALFARSAIEKALAGTAERHLKGLSQVLLLHEDRLPRRLRRRHERRPGETLMASYFKAWRGRHARMEFYLGGISMKLEQLGGRNGPLTERQSEAFMINVFFHELGHHVLNLSSPEHGDQEKLAEIWRRTLRDEYRQRQTS